MVLIRLAHVSVRNVVLMLQGTLERKAVEATEIVGKKLGTST